MKGIIKKVTEMVKKTQSGAMSPGSKTRGSRGVVGKLVTKLKEEGKLKNVAEKAVASATGMKKGGGVDKMGRAVKRKTADVKGRAMKRK